MAIIVRDEHLEKQIGEERERRGDATMAKTLCDLVREHLTELRIKREQSEHQVAASSG